MLCAIQTNISRHLSLDWQNVLRFWKRHRTRIWLLQNAFQQQDAVGFPEFAVTRTSLACSCSLVPQCSDTLSSFVLSQHWALNAPSLMGSAVEWDLVEQ